MLGVKQFEQPISREFLDNLQEEYKGIYGESLDNIIKKDSLDA